MTKIPEGALSDEQRIKLRNRVGNTGAKGYYMVTDKHHGGGGGMSSSRVSLHFVLPPPTYYFTNYFHALAYKYKLDRERKDG